ncbi:hypothetical protein BGZ93_000183 [Podila epicladia]|nr:hypothetical protein BGZ93_000183 [Podila epicladia]
MSLQLAAAIPRSTGRWVCSLTAARQRLFHSAATSRAQAQTQLQGKQDYSQYGKTFDKILIANRGEIACRVIRTAKKMGIKTVAIHSDADVNSLHVQLADEAVNVGPAPTSQSYLNIPNILKAIKDTGAQAVHPGYGFLSENATFVKALDEVGVTFIGPSQEAMASMGDKIQSKIIAKESKVNIIPGFNGVVRDVDHALEISREIGYPVMLKASAGGGGKGMRIAWNDEEVKEGYKIAKTESMASFGDDRLLIEKFIDNPRHIEIQIISDKHGNTLYLPERECSIQRRNQKVIEEAPSTHIDEKTRKAMGEQAVMLAKHVKYSSAGTVEFLYITGMDLVEQMIRVAANQKLIPKQSDMKINGWAIESRVYAEDPEKYLPSIGRLSKYIEPTSTKGQNEVRCDSGIVEGSEISIYYDPMICKLCTHGATRDEAIENMKRALDSYVIKGVTHNIPLLREVISHDRFGSGKYSTKFLAEEYPTGFKGHSPNPTSLAQLASMAGLMHAKRELRNWAWGPGREALLKEELQGKAPHSWEIFVGVQGVDEKVPVKVHKLGKGTNGEDEFEIHTPGMAPFKTSAHWPLESPLITNTFDNGEEVTLQYLDTLPLGFRVQHLGTKFDITINNPAQHALSKYMPIKEKASTTNMILSPMPGSVVSVDVKVGDVVAEGTAVATIEAMKMANVLRSVRAGVVKSVKVQAGDSVAGDELLIEFEEEAKEVKEEKK